MNSENPKENNPFSSKWIKLNEHGQSNLARQWRDSCGNNMCCGSVNRDLIFVADNFDYHEYCRRSGFKPSLRVRLAKFLLTIIDKLV